MNAHGPEGCCDGRESATLGSRSRPSSAPSLAGGFRMPVAIRPRLALATCAHLPGVHPDDTHLAASLAALGIEPVAVDWAAPAVDWTSFDAVLIRTTWDYFQRYEEFLRW